MNPLLIEVFSGFTYDEILPAIKDIGFDGFFSSQTTANFLEDLKPVRRMADQYGLLYANSHSTIPGCWNIWSDCPEGDEYINVLTNNIRNCIELSVPRIVVHVQPNFNNDPNWELGAKRLKPVVAYAKENNIEIAFENINSTEYLFKTLEYFDSSNVGFCYDTGHEACHTPGVRLLPQIGDRLFCTHIHDNDCARDIHQMPFDGQIDFGLMCRELKEIGYKGDLALELTYSGVYAETMTKREFLEKAFECAKKLKNMISD